MRTFTFIVLLGLLCGCRRETPHVFLSTEKIETAGRQAHAMMLAETNHPLVWDDAEAFTNVLLDIWGEGNDLRCRLLLTDQDFETSHGCRWQRFEYDFTSNGLIMEHGLGTMVE